MSRGSGETTGYAIEELMKSENGRFTLGPVRAVVTTQAAYAFMMQVIHEHAPHALKYAFYDMGYRVGAELMVGLVAGRMKDPEAALRQLVETYKRSGYGNLEVLEFDISLSEARLAGTDLFEAAVARESGVYRTPRCVDHYSRGMFAGFMSKLLGRDIVCEEIACQYRGDARCEFMALPFDGKR